MASKDLLFSLEKMTTKTDPINHHILNRSYAAGHGMKSVKKIFQSAVILFAALLMIIISVVPSQAQVDDKSDSESIPTVEQATKGLERQDGFFPFYYDVEEGKLYLEVTSNQLNMEFLYLNSLATGLGSVELGLDRGTVGDEFIAHFEQHGPKLLLIANNTKYRALNTENEALTRSVKESFGISVLGAFPVIGKGGGRMLVDATDFVLQDFYGVRARLNRVGSGNYQVDQERSAIYRPHTKAFPENTEIEVMLTFSSNKPSWEVRRHTPDGRSLTLREHYSLVKLPPPGYQPRAFDPRAGFFSLTFYDFTQPLTKSYKRRWITRWRLAPSDTAAYLSAKLVEPVDPIVYYLDPGIPEPYKSAFLKGAGSWNEVFEAAGYKNAFRVKILPDSIDPMDARYNVIQWVQRDDPGYSVGSSYIDPRTGEIIKAALRMDTYRSLTDFNIYAGVLPATPWGCEPAEQCPENWIAGLDPEVTPLEFAMARRRLHAAHEVGHTLGLAHNFIASSYGRASVMDYPAPYITLDKKGNIDLSNAYPPGPGTWDSLAIRYGYTWYPSEQAEKQGLDAIINDATQRNLYFITGRDAANYGAIPNAHRWTNGNDMVKALERAMRVRDVLIKAFDASAIRPGAPLSTLNKRFVPVYMHHRYAIEAASKLLGGMFYTYLVRGGPEPLPEIIDPARQRSALNLLIKALQSSELRIPKKVTRLIAPIAYGYDWGKFAFDSATDPVFDPLAAARTLSSFIVESILQPQRTARLVSFHARMQEAPSLNEVISGLVEGTWGQPVSKDVMAAALRRVASRAVLDGLFDLATNPVATADVRATVEWQLAQLADRLRKRESATTPAGKAHVAVAIRDIKRFLNRRVEPLLETEPLPAPPGTPIGQQGGGS